MRWELLLVYVTAANAFSLPFSFPFLAGSNQVQTQEVPKLMPKSSYDASKTVAIIGAGAGGASAAFFISKAKERYGLDLDVHVYDKSDYVGGRSTTVHPYDDPETRAIELGASIFVKANKNMWRASEEFNLSRIGFEDEDGVTGIWDGEKFIMTMGDGPFGWWDKIKLAWRYGYFSFKAMDTTVNKMLETFLSLYSRESPSWDSMESLMSALNWTEMVSQSSSDYFRSRGVSDNLINEVIDAATRVNYGQNVDVIHALEGACSLAASGASSVQGGNWRIFERFLDESQAIVYLNTTVKSIKWNGSSDTWTLKGPNGPVEYKSIIFAAPYHSTGIALPDSLSGQIPEQPYVHLHVTLLTTTAPHANPEYFGLRPTDKVATSVLTTSLGAHNGGKEPEFNSLTYHGTVEHNNQTEHVVKIFSNQTLSDEWLANMFSDKVGWVLRKEWDAYPKLPPTTTFPPIKLDKGFFYANSFEPFISTMETSIIAARNIVDLLLKEEFGTGLCFTRPQYADMKETEAEQEVLGVPSNTTSEREFVLGWDC